MPVDHLKPEGDKVLCRVCSWAAEMRGGTIEERIPFLEKRFVEHMREHPGQPLEYLRNAMPRMLQTMTS
jgi:hypothetical protein